MKTALFVVFALALSGGAFAINCGDEVLSEEDVCCKNGSGQCVIVPREVGAGRRGWCEGPNNGRVITDEDCVNDRVVFEALARPVTTSDEHDAETLAILRRNRGVVPPLRVHRDVGDGNCQFRAISYQLWGTEEHHHELRGIAMDYIEANAMHYRYAIEAHVAAGFREDQWDEYIAGNRAGARHGGDSERYGGEETANALANALGLEIYIVKTNNQLNEVLPTVDARGVTKKVFIIHTGIHYNDVQYGAADDDVVDIGKNYLRGEVRPPVNSEAICDKAVHSMWKDNPIQSDATFKELCVILSCEEGDCAPKNNMEEAVEAPAEDCSHEVRATWSETPNRTEKSFRELCTVFVCQEGECAGKEPEVSQSFGDEEVSQSFGDEEIEPSSVLVHCDKEAYLMLKESVVDDVAAACETSCDEPDVDGCIRRVGEVMNLSK